ncbi:MAG: type II toxin-antitoxin system antitoxin SocA domain-containing protein, partial [Myxococcota bacterium]
GPVIPSVYAQHKRCRLVTENMIDAPGQPLSEEECATVDAVLEFYGRFTGDELSRLTHCDRPWNEAHAHGESAPISHESLRRYYQMMDSGEKRLSLSLYRGLGFLLSLPKGADPNELFEPDGDPSASEELDAFLAAE